ncbi:MAG: hypothetical protein IPJ81_18140 [Chitinophagaceae bacterium]|nr:hypothetical protein [Chitinophagaceae bacterium]
MLPIDFEGTNLILSKPANMTDEQCTALKAYKGVDNDGFPFFVTAWQPSKEDIESINSGKPIMLKILGTCFPPVALYTLDENNNSND